MKKNKKDTWLWLIVIFLLGLLVLQAVHAKRMLFPCNDNCFAQVRRTLETEYELSDKQKEILADTAGWTRFETPSGKQGYQYVDQESDGYHVWRIFYLHGKLVMKDPVYPYVAPVGVTRAGTVPAVAPRTYYQPSLLTSRDIIPDKFGLRGIRAGVAAAI